MEATFRRANGHEETVHADWLAGCAHSIVRHTLGAAFTGETLPSDWVLADTHMKGYPFPDTEVAVYWAREGVLPIFPIAPGRYRIIANVPPTGGDHPRDPTLEEMQAIIQQRHGGVSLFDPIWLSGFQINARKVASYRAGRAFLTGDAAHVRSPAGGEGMNTGMQDAFNLAWKLAMTIHGTGGEALLDTYSRAERCGLGLEEHLAPHRQNQHPSQSAGGGASQHCRQVCARSDASAARSRQQYDAGVGGLRTQPNEQGPHMAHFTRRPAIIVAAGSPGLSSGSGPRFTLLASASAAVTDLLACYPKLLSGALSERLRKGRVAPAGRLRRSHRARHGPIIDFGRVETNERLSAARTLALPVRTYPEVDAYPTAPSPGGSVRLARLVLPARVKLGSPLHPAK